jgi:hypothetical protein
VRCMIHLLTISTLGLLVYEEKKDRGKIRGEFREGILVLARASSKSPLGHKMPTQSALVWLRMTPKGLFTM